MGLRDFFSRRGNRGGRGSARGGGGSGRGRRDGGRARERDRHEPTQQIQNAGQYAPAPPGGRDPTVATPAPSGWSPPPRPSQHVPDVAPRVPQPAPPPTPAPRPDESSKTRYGEVAAVPRGRVAGVLIATEGDLEGEVFKVYDGENKCGRSKHCQVHLPSEWISREHALLIHQDGVFAIRPLKDENPVVVNGERTEGAALQDGDVLRLGRTTFRFRSAG